MALATPVNNLFPQRDICSLHTHSLSLDIARPSMTLMLLATSGDRARDIDNALQIVRKAVAMRLSAFSNVADKDQVDSTTNWLSFDTAVCERGGMLNLKRAIRFKENSVSHRDRPARSV
jgi:hypothetical protein